MRTGGLGMILKSYSLHFEIMKGTTKPSAYIRNSYRENGKIKHQTVSRINGLSLEQLQNMKAAFDGETLKLGDMTISNGREYGASAMLFELAKIIGLDKLIYSKFEPWVRNVLAMVIGRIVFQGSKLALSNVSEISCLWEVCGVHDAEINVNHHCYDAMDELLARQKQIQKKLASKHLAEGTVILYDITSSYLEGEYEDSKTVAFGHNRDKKCGKKQIVIALICTKDGCPVAVEVFSGNTSDCTTVQSKINEIKTDYGISSFVFVGDRGMLTQKNIDECGDIDTITALTHSAMKILCEEKNVQLSMFDEKTTTEVILPEEPQVRYGLCKNPLKAEQDAITRSNLIEKTEGRLAEIAIPKKKTNEKTLAARAEKVFCKYKTEKYFSWDIKDMKIVYSRKQELIAREEKYDGLYVIRSSVSNDVMNISEVVETYKALTNIEQAFRSMKTVQLEIRPIYHRTDDRIKAHVFLCMLSYYLLWRLNKSLAPLYKNRPAFTRDHVMEVMKSLQKSTLTIAGVSTETIAKPTDIQQIIQNLVVGQGQ
jgi:transposase